MKIKQKSTNLKKYTFTKDQLISLMLFTHLDKNEEESILTRGETKNIIRGNEHGGYNFKSAYQIIIKPWKSFTELKETILDIFE